MQAYMAFPAQVASFVTTQAYMALQAQVASSAAPQTQRLCKALVYTYSYTCKLWWLFFGNLDDHCFAGLHGYCDVYAFVVLVLQAR